MPSKNYGQKSLFFLTIISVFQKTVLSKNIAEFSSSIKHYNELSEHSLVTENGAFPYMVAILKKTTYLCAGALVDDTWVLTAADSLFFLRESARVIRVRLGSHNSKKGGLLSPIKRFEIHPNFNDARPEYDIALVKLPHAILFTPTLHPITLQNKVTNVTRTHFTVVSWPTPLEKTSRELQQIQSMEQVERRRMLTISRLHPSDEETCSEEKEGYEIPPNVTDTIMCLDPALGDSPCNRDTGAPVVRDGVLWGIVSSWKSEDCEIDAAPSFVTLVSAPSVKRWLHCTLKEKEWNQKNDRVVSEENHSDDNYEELLGIENLNSVDYNMHY